MIDDTTLGIAAAQSRTRITAFLVDANFSGSAIRIQNTFWFATLNSVAEVTW